MVDRLGNASEEGHRSISLPDDFPQSQVFQCFQNVCLVTLKPSPHEQVFCGKFSVTKMFACVYRQKMLCWKLVSLCARNDCGQSTQNRRSHCQLLSMWQIFCDGSCARTNFCIWRFSLCQIKLARQFFRKRVLSWCGFEKKPNTDTGKNYRKKRKISKNTYISIFRRDWNLMNMKSNFLTKRKTITRKTFYQRRRESSFNLKHAAIGKKRGFCHKRQFREF